MSSSIEMIFLMRATVRQVSRARGDQDGLHEGNAHGKLELPVIASDGFMGAVLYGIFSINHDGEDLESQGSDDSGSREVASVHKQ